MKKLVLITIISAIFLGVICGIALAKEFTDINASHWAFSYVNSLSDLGIINGYEDGSFKPSGVITRAEFVKLIVSATSDDSEMEKIINENFGKTKHWYDGYAAYGLLLGIVRYYSDEEYIEPMPRIEMAEALYNACKYKGIIKEEVIPEKDSVTETAEKLRRQAAFELGYIKSMDISEDEYNKVMSKLKAKDTKKLSEKMAEIQIENAKRYGEEHALPSGDTKKLAYSDIKNVHPTIQDEIEKISNLGLIKGYEDGTFRPDNSLTRAEVATVIYRFINLKGE